MEEKVEQEDPSLSCGKMIIPFEEEFPSPPVSECGCNFTDAKIHFVFILPALTFRHKYFYSVFLFLWENLIENFIAAV